MKLGTFKNQGYCVWYKSYGFECIRLPYYWVVDLWITVMDV